MCDCNKELTIRVKYHSDVIDKIQNISIGDWTDLRAAEDLDLKQWDFRFIDLGISVEVPEGYEMHIAPRSSTFKNFGIIQVNSVGILDESYSGDNDIVKMPALALRDTQIRVNDRICQCRLVPKQPKTTWLVVETLGNKDRGGLGSTGTNAFIGNAQIV